MGLGVEVNQGLKQGLTEHRTLLDSVRSAINTIGQNIAATTQVKSPLFEIPDPSASRGPGWAGYLCELQQNIKHIEAKARRPAPMVTNGRVHGIIHNIKDLHDYFVRVEALLISHDTKTWDELYPQNEVVQSNQHLPVFMPTLAIQSNPGYALATRPGHSWLAVPQHMVPRYDELYEACFTGDDKTIKELCLPTGPSQSAHSPLQIAVQTVGTNMSVPNAGMSLILLAYILFPA